MPSLRAKFSRCLFVAGVVLLIGGFCFTPQAAAQTCYAVNGGDWETGSNWADSETGSGGSCSLSDGYPNATGEDAVIEGAIMNIDVDAGSALTIGNLTVSSSGGLVRPESKLNATTRDFNVSDVTINSSGSISEISAGTNNGLLNITVSGSLDNFSTVNVDNGTITVSGFFDNDGTTSVGNNGLLDVNDAFTTRTGGSLQLNNGTFRVEGNFTNNGSFSTTQGLVDFDGSSPQTLVGDFSGTGGFFDVQVDASAEVDPSDNSTIGNSESVRVDGNMTIEGQYGSGDSELADLSFQGNTFDVNGDFFADEIRFNNGGSSSAAGTVFSTVRVTNNTKLTLDASFTINGKLIIESDEVEVTTSPLTLNGDVSIGDGAVLDPQTNAIVMSGMGQETADGNNTQNIVGDAVQNFGNLTVRDTTGDNNNTPDTKVKFSSGSNQLDVNQFTIDEASVTSGRPVFIEGDFTAQNNGTFSFSGDATQELVRFDGSTQQQLDSPTSFTFNVVEIANGGATPPQVEVTSGSNLAVTDTLTLTQGTLGPTGGLTIPSGGIIQYNGGNVSGDIVAERQLTGTAPAWYAISPPGKNVTLKSFEESGPNDIWTSGNVNADNAQADSGSVALYDEAVPGTQDKGYTFPDLSQSFGPNSGSFYYVYNDDTPFDDSDDAQTEGFPKTVASVGEPRTSSSFTYSLDYTDSGAAASEDGWNLISNPYLTVVDWDDFDFSDSCIDNTVYIHEPGTGDSGGYSALSYTAGSGSSGSLFEQYGYIAPFQSIWVHTTCSPTTQLSISDITTAQVTATDRTTDGANTDDPFQKAGPSQDVGRLQLVMEKDNLRSRALFAFRGEATPQKDAWDAYDVQFQGAVDNTRPRIKLHAVLENGKTLKTSSLPDEFGDSVSFPLNAYVKGCKSGAPYGGDATLRWPMIENLPADWGLVLEDTQADKKVNLRRSSEYTFTLDGLTSSTTCSGGSKSLGATSGGRTDRPAPPSPDVITYNTGSKSSDTGARFRLTIKPNAALPVELTTFTAERDQQAAVLNWSTASEQNNTGFYVQRKTEDGAFTTLDGSFQKGAGTTTDATSYSYRVEDLEAGTQTFRLKQVDQDGSASFSDPVDVKIGLDGKYKLNTYPNPVSQAQATLEFAVKEQDDVTITLYNTLGQKVRTVYRGETPAEETTRVQVDTRSLASGVYFVRLQGETVTATTRMTVVK
jgi:hypothetical protein